MALQTLGGTAIASGSVLTRAGAAGAPQPDEADAPECALCHRSKRVAKLLRFHLEYRRPGKGGRGKTSGSILLCEKCWAGCQ